VLPDFTRTKSSGRLAFSPDGSKLALTDGKNVLLADPTGRMPVEALPKLHNSNVVSLAFSPDGGTLASGSGSLMEGIPGEIFLWDVATRSPREEPLREGFAEIVTIAFDPRGKFIITGSRGGPPVAWDMSIDSWIHKACKAVGRSMTMEERATIMGQGIKQDSACEPSSTPQESLPVGPR
jgi:WD40 repeat protein